MYLFQENQLFLKTAYLLAIFRCKLFADKVKIVLQFPKKQFVFDSFPNNVFDCKLKQRLATIILCTVMTIHDLFKCWEFSTHISQYSHYWFHIFLSFFPIRINSFSHESFHEMMSSKYWCFPDVIWTIAIPWKKGLLYPLANSPY